MKKLFVLGDSPTHEGGFARVVQNLLKRWRKYFDIIDVWGINFNGVPNPHNVKYVDNLFPAVLPGFPCSSWRDPNMLTMFLQRLHDKGYTHLWVIYDLAALRLSDFSKAIYEVCHAKKVKSFLYYPVDAPQDPSWVEVLEHFHRPVAYLQYGIDESIKAGCKRKDLIHIPHGVDTEVYKPLENRASVRNDVLYETYGKSQAKFTPHGFCSDDDFLMVNTNQNQIRKDPASSLVLLKAIKELGIKNARLIMHCNKVSNDGIDLEKVGNQLGLVVGKDWIHSTDIFTSNMRLLDQRWLNGLYNSADACISSSLGEGWGLTSTEALAAGCLSIMPNNTSLKEIGQKIRVNYQCDRFINIPVDAERAYYNDNSRVRQPINIRGSAEMIAEIISNHKPNKDQYSPLPAKIKEWLSWDRIADEWATLMEVK